MKPPIKRIPSLLFCCSLFFVFFVLFPSFSWALTYYVSPSGSDDQQGTSRAQAWKTLDRVNSGHYEPGDRILLEGGKTFSGSLLFQPNNFHGTMRDPITIGSFNRGRAVIESGKQAGLFATGVSGLIVTNLKFRGDFDERSSGPAESNGVWFYNERDTPVSFIRVQNLEVSGYGTGIFILAEPGSGFHDVKVEKVQVHDNQSGVEMFGLGGPPSSELPHGLSKVYVGHSKVYSNRGSGGTRSQVSDDFSGCGISVQGVQEAVIEHNEVYDNGGRLKARPGYEGGPFGIEVLGDKMMIHNNQVSAQHAHSSNLSGHGGFRLRGKNGVIQNNYSHDNDGTGFLFDGTEDQNMTLRYNISENDARAVQEAALSFQGNIQNVECYNNTFFEKEKSFDTRPLIYLAGADGGKGVFEKLSFRNNIFLTDGTPFLHAVDPEALGVLFENNAWFDVSGRSVFAWGDHFYEGIETWSENSGQERAPQGLSGRTADPLFCKAGTRDPKGFNLRPESPLIGKALNLREQSGLDTGEEDNPADLGALRYLEGQEC